MSWKYRRGYLEHLRNKHPNEYYSDKSWGRPHAGGKERQYEQALYLRAHKGRKVGRPKKQKRGRPSKSKSVPDSDINMKKTPAKIGKKIPGLSTPYLSGK